MIKLADNLELPLNFMTERIAFLARTGAGKSGGMRVLFEQIFDAGQFVIFIDPKGDAWGIRASGKKAGKAVLVMGGDHADVPLEATSGKVVAEFLVRERISTVIDISDFSTPDMWKFVAQFCSTLYRLNREALHLFIDEADMLAGQTYFDPHTLHGIQLIQNKGRARGFGVTVATQRPQILNKTVLNASGTLIAMQAIGDDALKVVKSWLMQSGTKEAAAEILAAIPTLQTREAFVYSPQILGIEPVRIKFAEFQTFDSMRTPKPGEVRQAPKSLADIDLAVVQRDMAATIEKAKSEDPAELKKKINSLERDLAAAKKVHSVAALETKPVEVQVPVPVLDEAKLEELDARVRSQMDGLLQIGQNFKDSIDKLILLETGPTTKLLADLRKAKPVLPAGYSLNKPAFSLNKISQPVNTPPKTQQTQKRMHSGPGDSSLPEGERKILIVIAQYSNRGGASRDLISILTGYAKSSRNTYISRLSSKGYVEGSQTILPTPEGLAALGEYEQLPEGIELQQWWLNRLPEGEAKILRILCAAYPSAVDRDQVSVETGYAKSSRNTYISRLSTKRLVISSSAGVRAADDLF